MAVRLGIEDLLSRYPSELSGGEAQRVALGRALVRKPKLFLLDEPLSNLDLPLRDRLRTLIRELVEETGVTTLYVTHDQGEAMAVGDRLAMMTDGKLQQVGVPRELYEAPANLAVARFFGSPPMNLLPGIMQIETVEGQWGRIKTNSALAVKDVLFGIRPEDLIISDDGEISATFVRADYQGSRTIAVFDCAGQELRMTAPADSQLPSIGEKVRLTADENHAHLFDAKTGIRI